MRVARSKPKEKLPEMIGWSDEQITEFWETRDSTELFRPDGGCRGKTRDSPRLSGGLSLRLEAEDIERAKRLARRKGSLTRSS